MNPSFKTMTSFPTKRCYFVFFINIDHYLEPIDIYISRSANIQDIIFSSKGLIRKNLLFQDLVLVY